MENNSPLEERLILEKAKQRFLRTKIEDIKITPYNGEGKIKAFEYFIDRGNVHIKFHYSLGKDNKENFSLGILTSRGKSIMWFDDFDPSYYSDLKEIHNLLLKKEENLRIVEEKKQERVYSKIIRRLEKYL